MQRTCCLGLLAALLMALGACTKRTPPAGAPGTESGGARGVVVDDGKGQVGNGAGVTTPPAGESEDERFTAALEKAVDLYARQKYAEALAAYEEAQKVRKTDSVALEIAKLRAVVDAAGSEQKAVEDVRTVLEEGQAEEAARLASTALEQYGDGDRADDLARLKQQADAVVTAAADDARARQAALKAEAVAALKAKNLRAAAIAIEQALLLGEDDALSKQLEDLRDRLKTYDDNRRLATEYRRDATEVDAALTRLLAAQKAWDTPRVRQEIDEVRLVAERRRDRVSVADFEVVDDVGTAGAGRSVAEDLLPHFKGRFDLVERSQLARVMDELKLDGADLVEVTAGGREVGRLAKVRYVVVGSVTPLAGVTVRARLVEVGTGLVVQTAKVSAASVEDLDRAPAPGKPSPLKQLALMLQMTDEQKMAYEAALQEAAAAVKPVEATPVEDVPPPPPPPEERGQAPPPPPIVTYTPRPQPLGAPVVTLVEQFGQLPAVVAAPPPPLPALGVVLVRDDPRRHRLLRLSLELGDNLFRRRRYAEAQRHFGLALTLAGPKREIALRLDLCRRLAPPPPPPVVVVPPPVAVVTAPPVVVVPPRVRPRLAVFGFVVNCKPGLVPPAISDWAADQMASYCARSYELIDRGEVCWYMGRLNITMSDLLRDPVARRCLAQSLGARYFVFGAIQETASFNVSTTLVDAETGATTGKGAIHVKDQSEMKLRLGELATQIGAGPADQVKLAKQGEDSEKVLGEARALLAAKPPQAARAAELLRDARKTYPGSVAIATLLAEAEKRQKQEAFEAARRKEADERRLAEVQAKKRQQELAQKAAAERVKAAAEARARSEAEKKKQEQQKEAAAGRLRQQAADAAKKGDPARAVQLLQSAAALRPSAAIDQELGQARAAQRAAADRAAQAERERLAKAQEAQRQAAAKRVESERQARAKAEADRKAALDAREKGLHDGYIQQANALLAKKDYAGAAAAAQSARRHLASDASAKLLRQAQDAAALAEAEKKGAAEKARVEAERKKREAEAAASKKRQDDYNALLTKGKAAIDAKKYDEAANSYAEARKLFATDVALNGQKAAEALRDRERAAAKASADAKAAEAKKAARVKELLGLGEKALAARKYDEAVKHYGEAGQIDRGNAQALAGLSRAERERDAESLRLKREKQAMEDYKLAMAAGLDAVKKKNLQGAVNAYGLALKYRPGDAAATAALAEAQRQLKAVQQGAMAAAAYASWMKQADAAMKGQKYAEALAAYDAALKNKPGDAAAVAGKRAAQQALDAARPKPDPKVEEARKREADYQAWVKAAQAAMTARKYAEALKAYDAALKNKPGDAAAIAGKRAAQQALDAARPKPDPKAEEARKREADYQAWVKAAQAAMTARKYAEALKAYDAAIKNKPGDAAAVAGKKAAQQALDAARPKPKPDPKAEAAQAMQRGKALEQQGKYADAAAAYGEALKHLAGDYTRDPALQAAQFAAYLGAGRSHHAARKYADAVKAYEEALKRQPASTEAKAALARAKAGKP